MYVCNDDNLDENPPSALPLPLPQIQEIWN